MNTPNNNSMVMRDYSDRDPRSFKAALKGRGDGRAADYDHFARNLPASMDMDTVASEYSRRLALGRRRVSLVRFSPAKAVRALVVAAVGLLLGAMLFQILLA